MNSGRRIATAVLVAMPIVSGFSPTVLAQGLLGQRAATRSGRPFSATDPFKQLTGIAVDRHGYVYVSDEKLDSILKVSPAGKVIARWGRKGAGLGRFDGPGDVALDRNGNIYIADLNNERIQKLSPAGKPLAAWSTSVRRLAVDGKGNIWGTGGIGVVELSPSGRQITTWKVPKPQDTGTNEGLALDPHGALYVTDEYFNRIFKLTTTGKLIRAWGKHGQNKGQLDSPEGAALDRKGNLYVAEMGNDRVQKFSPAGKSLATYGDFFTTPIAQSVAVDGSGNIYVADPADIQKFSPRGKHLASWH